MSSKSSIYYKEFSCPHINYTASPSKTLLESHLLQEINETVVGEPIKLVDFAHAPNWYVLFVFEMLRKNCPEVVLDVSQEQKLLLFSVLSSEEYTRSENVFMIPELIFESHIVPVERVQEYTFDLSHIPLPQGKDVFHTLLHTVLFVKQKMKFVEKLILTGKSDPLTSLLVYAIALKYSKSIVYQAPTFTFEII